jgi:hypothetical protein
MISKFTILPCELSDPPACASIFHSAFATDPTMLCLYVNCDPEALKAKTLKNYEKSFSKPGVRYFKAIDKNGYVCLAVL